MADNILHKKRKIPVRFTAEQAKNLILAALDDERSSDNDPLTDEESTGSDEYEQQEIDSNSDSDQESETVDQTADVEQTSDSQQRGKNFNK